MKTISLKLPAGLHAKLDRAAKQMRARGMDIAAVETGGDRGHAPARAMYEAAGYKALPVVRYLKLLDRD